MKRLVVHIGPPKTASTYIQKGLEANALALAERGVHMEVTSMEATAEGYSFA